MVRKRLAAPLAVTLAVPLISLALPTTAGVAASDPGRSGAAASDITLGEKAPRLVDGEKVPAPSTYTAPARSKLRTSSAAADPTPEVGTVRQWIASDDTTGYYRKDYTLRGVGDHIEVWVANDLAFPEGDCRNAVEGSTTVTDAQVTELVEQFDTTMYPTETAAFSTPPDRDGSNSLLGPDKNGNGGVYTGGGEKTVTLVDNVRDDNYYDFPAVQTYTAGFFSSYLTELFDRNTMTIDAFDWTHRTTADPQDASTSDPCTSRPARPWLYEGVFGHEWQHLLHYYTDPNEVTWVNEGLSDLAIALDGYADTTAAVTEAGFDNHIICYQGYGTVETDYNPNPRDCGGAQNSLNLWGEDGDNPNAVLADYGQAFSFMLFLHDRYGLDLLTALHNDGELQGLASLEALLGKSGDDEVYDVLHDFQSSTLLDGFLDASRRSRISGITRSRVTSESLESSVNLDNPQSYAEPGAAPNGADYVPIRAGGKDIRGKDLKSLEFSGAKTLPPVPLSWTVVDDDPDRPGNPVLFSGNDNNTDAAAVTAVTVPTTDPTLRFLAKYGAEATYDYGYVSVSTDGGKTYSAPIPGTNTVDDGPLGPGLNGTTTGFEQQEYDLSAYAGQDVLISIRYVSDGGVNEGGLLIDDVTVGGTVVSDGSSLEPFDSTTEIVPVTVHNWNLRLVGLDSRRHEAVQVAFDGEDTVTLDRKKLRRLKGFDQVVAIVAYDEPTEQVQQYAPYTLTVNGTLQPGGSGSATD
ncbi:immune inhibitor A [Kineosporia sp. J2-2]|uniref:Immune inhibitor A n=1 Tax=Kineosporia corallincola TaxID=2835133 RepID=A0ABS5TJ90_9ACTN|nr:immune inhibitor A domain-containing protein [Kineosporia corallincola]MBT0770128.1 immune inhibitor A [Kineosporia corallincola]